MDAKLNAIRDGHARGEILKLIRTQGRAQRAIMDHVLLWRMLGGLGLDVGEDDVITFIQDLEILECLEYHEERNRQTNRLTLSRIKICPRGLRVLDGKVEEETVLL